MLKVRKQAVLFGTAAILALGLIAAPVGFDNTGFGLEAAAAAGKGGGMDSECPPAKRKKGNNGWGNGGDDGTNNGSDEGAQAPSKSADEFR